MKSLPLMLTAAGLLALSGPSYAAPRDVEAYLQRATAEASAQAAAAGVELPSHGVRLRGRVNGDGRLSGLHVARTSGSTEADLKTAHALRRLRVADPPNLLIGAEVVVTVAPQPIVQATSP